MISPYLLTRRIAVVIFALLLTHRIAVAIFAFLYPVIVIPLTIVVHGLNPDDPKEPRTPRRSPSLEDVVMLSAVIIGSVAALSGLYAFFGGQWLGFSIPETWWIGGAIIYTACSVVLWKQIHGMITESLISV